MTINCAERGLLLLRVRDEIRMTIAAYQTLYESSVAFGMRKALQAEQGKAEMERKVCDCTVLHRYYNNHTFVYRMFCFASDRRIGARQARFGATSERVEGEV